MNTEFDDIMATGNEQDLSKYMDKIILILIDININPEKAILYINHEDEDVRNFALGILKGNTNESL